MTNTMPTRARHWYVSTRLQRPSCAGVPADQRVACIFNNGIAAGCRDPREIRALEHALEIANAEIDQLPTIAPATRGVHPSLTFADVCVSVQRANNVHHAWMALARDGGHTLDGFHNSWMASLAHAQIHVERTLGMKMPPLVPADLTNPLNPTVNVDKGGFRDPYEIRSYVYAIVPGVVEGVCDPYWLPQ